MTDISSDTSPNGTSADKPLLPWIWGDYLKPHWPKIAVALVLMAIEGSMLGALSYIVQPMFDEVFIAGDRGAIFGSLVRLSASSSSAPVRILATVS